jgi:hypothetical protein
MFRDVTYVDSESEWSNDAIARHAAGHFSGAISSDQRITAADGAAGTAGAGVQLASGIRFCAATFLPRCGWNGSQGCQARFRSLFQELTGASLAML